MDPRLKAAVDDFVAAGENLRQTCRDTYPEGCLVEFDEGPMDNEYVTVCRVVRHSSSARYRPSEILMTNIKTGKTRIKDAESLRHHKPLASGVA